MVSIVPYFQSNSTKFNFRVPKKYVVLISFWFLILNNLIKYVSLYLNNLNISFCSSINVIKKYYFPKNALQMLAIDVFSLTFIDKYSFFYTWLFISYKITLYSNVRTNVMTVTFITMCTVQHRVTYSRVLYYCDVPFTIDIVYLLWRSQVNVLKP